MTGPMEATYKVVHLVAKSQVSWEDAARNGIAEAGKTIVELRRALVTQLDAVISEDGVTEYRLELEVSFQLDRSRPAEGVPVTVRRYLIVANRTLARNIVPRLVAKRMAAGPSEFHVLVPASRSKHTRQLMALAGDPMSGYTPVDVEGLRAARANDTESAHERLATFETKLDDLGATFTSEVGDPDALRAVARVMERSSFDEVIVSTGPAPISRWLRLDLPSRIERAHNVSVMTITPPSGDGDVGGDTTPDQQPN